MQKPLMLIFEVGSIFSSKYILQLLLEQGGGYKEGCNRSGRWVDGGAGPEQNDTAGAVRGALPNTKRLSVKSVYHSGLTAHVLVPKSIL